MSGDEDTSVAGAKDIARARVPVCAEAGVAPPKRARDDAGVSLSRPEQRFLHLLVSFMRDKSNGYDMHVNELYEPAEKIGLNKDEVKYIVGWIENRGIHYIAADESACHNEIKQYRMFSNPEIRRIIDGAADRGLCMGFTASKEEIAAFLTQRMRATYLPDEYRDRAADRLAKLMGYNPKEGSSGPGAVNIQINCVNPYGGNTE